MKHYGCKNSLPHDFVTLADFADVVVEQCKLCGRKYRWPRDKRGRIDNKKYLREHARDFAQATGQSAQLYYALYKPEEYEKNKDKWIIKL